MRLMTSWVKSEAVFLHRLIATSMQVRRAKFRRQPEMLKTFNLSACDIAIIAAIYRYRLLPSSLLVRLVPCNIDVVYRRTRNLYDRQLVNRFALPRAAGPAGEFIYYLDN